MGPRGAAGLRFRPRLRRLPATPLPPALRRAVGVQEPHRGDFTAS